VSQPLVSVLTPSFNQGRFLGDCLTSVANQTYGNIEHIVMDGGSTDETLDVLKAATKPVLWTSEPDEGQSHALNKALAVAQGEIIGWLNSDDAYVDRRSVAEAVRIFEEHPEVGVVYGHSLVINASNRVLQFLWAPPAAERLMFTGLRYTQPAVILRRSVIPKLFLREDLHFLMDRDLWLRLRGKTVFRRLNCVVGADRHHRDRKTEGAGYDDEKRSFRQERLERLWPPLCEKAGNLILRPVGAAKILSFKGGIEPAFDLRFDATLPLLKRQLFERRLGMPED
jgi:glycosyltransferase involved in cell wall biosynthesis